MQKINDAVLQPLVSLLMAVAVGYFLFGVMKFVKEQDNADTQEEGKRHLVWGIVGLAIMVSVWGILNFLNSFIPDVSV